MKCPGGTIDSQLIERPDRDEVLRKCGEPDAKYNEGYRWVYNQAQWVYVLQFNNEGKLIMIQRAHPEKDSG